MVAGSDTLEIHTSGAEFVFNADCFDMFDGLDTITAIDFNNCINTANVLFMGDMFYDCSALTSLDLSSFNTVNVRDMGSMFRGCSSLESLDLSSFDFGNVTDFEDMFYDLGLYATNTPIYIYVKDEIDKIILSATTDIPKYRVIISVKQP